MIFFDVIENSVDNKYRLYRYYKKVGRPRSVFDKIEEARKIAACESCEKKGRPTFWEKMLTNVDNCPILYLEMTEILLLYLTYEELTQSH